MHQPLRRLVWYATFIFATLLVARVPVLSQTSDSLFIDVDVAPDSTVDGVVDELEKIVILCAAPDQSSFVRLMSLNSRTGEQIGEVVNVDVPPSPCVPPEPIHPPDPIKVMYSRCFMPGDVLVLHADHVVSYEHILLSRQGTPQFGSWNCMPPMIDPTEVSEATAIGEMPGDAFSDGQPRLLIGTRTGQIVVIVMSGAGGPVVERIITDLFPPEPIKEIEPIQMADGDVHAGIGTGVDIYGLLDIDAGAAAPRLGFHLIPQVGDEVLVADFGFFHDIFSGATLDDDHEFIITDGTSSALTLASFPSNASGVVTYSVMRTVPPNPVMPVSHIATGSLLMVAADSSGVYYDPSSDSLTGPSGCSLEITDSDPSGCACCVGLRGDVNGDGVDADPVDLSYLVDFLFSSGPAPICDDEADVNGDTASADPVDLSYLVDFLFSAGPVPVACP